MQEQKKLITIIVIHILLSIPQTLFSIFPTVISYELNVFISLAQTSLSAVILYLLLYFLSTNYNYNLPIWVLFFICIPQAFTTLYTFIIQNGIDLFGIDSATPTFYYTSVFTASAFIAFLYYNIKFIRNPIKTRAKSRLRNYGLMSIFYPIVISLIPLSMVSHTNLSNINDITTFTTILSEVFFILTNYVLITFINIPPEPELDFSNTIFADSQETEE